MENITAGSQQKVVLSFVTSQKGVQDVQVFEILIHSQRDL